MKKVLQKLRDINPNVTVEVKAEEDGYKAMLYLEGEILCTAESNSWKILMKFLASKEVRRKIIETDFYNGIMRDKGFNELLRSLC